MLEPLHLKIQRNILNPIRGAGLVIVLEDERRYSASLTMLATLNGMKNGMLIKDYHYLDYKKFRTRRELFENFNGDGDELYDVLVIDESSYDNKEVLLDHMEDLAMAAVGIRYHLFLITGDPDIADLLLKNINGGNSSKCRML